MTGVVVVRGAEHVCPRQANCVQTAIFWQAVGNLYKEGRIKVELLNGEIQIRGQTIC